MTTIARDKRRQELLALREETMQTVNRLHHGDEGAEEINVAAGDQHPADHASALMDREIDETLEGYGERLVQAIDEALARIDDGTYGICAVCGKPIPEERLDAIPYATLCVEDKRAQEQR
jgi:RNA polymerase-binding protein DksA